MSSFERDLNPIRDGYNIAGIKMHLLVWHVLNKMLKFCLTFLILSCFKTINSPLTALKLKPTEIITQGDRGLIVTALFTNMQILKFKS